ITEMEKNLQSRNPIPIDMLFEIFLNLPAKSLASSPHYPGTISVCIDGVLYYSASSSFTMDEPLFLVRFGLRSESLEVASKFPEGLESSNRITLINYHGKVAVADVSEYRYGDFKLWVLEDAKKQQWSKEQRISIHTGVTGKLHEGLEILGTSNMGEIIFAPNYFKELIVYFLDHKNNKIRSVELEGNTKYKFRDFYKVFTFLHYVESVMLI
ncbi:F-box associated domain type 3, partial [Arabidopsis thaliana x Arabidopsis arenosa]